MTYNVFGGTLNLAQSLRKAELTKLVGLHVAVCGRCDRRAGGQCGSRAARCSGDHPRRRPGRPTAAGAAHRLVAGGAGTAAAVRVPEPVAAQPRSGGPADPAASQPLPSTSTARLHSPL